MQGLKERICPHGSCMVEEGKLMGSLEKMEPDNAKERSQQSMTYWSRKRSPHQKLF